MSKSFFANSQNLIVTSRGRKPKKNGQYMIFVSLGTCCPENTIDQKRSMSCSSNVQLIENRFSNKLYLHTYKYTYVYVY